MSPATAKRCPRCSGPVLERPGCPRKWCSARCRKLAWEKMRRAQTARPPGLARCVRCQTVFQTAPGHPNTRFCSKRCHNRARSKALTVRLYPDGRAVLGQQGADGSTRTLRCPCGRALGYAVNAHVLVLDTRVVLQLGGAGQLRLAAACAACDTTRTVVQLPAPKGAEASHQRWPAGLVAVGL